MIPLGEDHVSIAFPQDMLQAVSWITAPHDQTRTTLP